MRGPLVELLKQILPEIRKNKFWEEGRLVEEENIKKNIEEIIGNVKEHYQNLEIHGIYIYGSVMELKEKKRYVVGPEDIDVWVWVNGKADSDIKFYFYYYKLRTGYKPYGKTMDIHIYNRHLSLRTEFSSDFYLENGFYVIYETEGVKKDPNLRKLMMNEKLINKDVPAKD